MDKNALFYRFLNLLKLVHQIPLYGKYLLVCCSASTAYCTQHTNNIFMRESCKVQGRSFPPPPPPPPHLINFTYTYTHSHEVCLALFIVVVVVFSNSVICTVIRYKVQSYTISEQRGFVFSHHEFDSYRATISYLSATNSNNVFYCQ